MESPLYFYGQIDKSEKSKVLSNWYQSEFIDPDDNQSYLTSEQYMMAKKAELFKDDESHNMIMSLIVLSEAKILGRKVKNLTTIFGTKCKKYCNLWLPTMKFTQNKHLREYILSMG